MDRDYTRRLSEETPLSSSLAAVVEPGADSDTTLEEAVVASEAPLLRSGDIHGDVWRMAWPSVVTFSLMTTNMILDRMFVGRLGPVALAAVGVGGQFLFLLVSISMAVSVGTTALVSRFTGAENPDDAARATGQSIALAAAMGLLGTFLAYAILPLFFAAMKLAPEARAECQTFLNMGLLGTLPLFIANVLASAFRGLGDTRSPLKVMICVNIIHILGDLTLMLGYFGAPRLGLAGAGIALTLANLVSVGIYLLLMRSTSIGHALTVSHLRLTREWSERLLRVGIPAALTAILRVTSLMGFTGILARTAERTFAVAALPIGMTAESLAFMPGFGFSVAAAALVGQSLGAKDPDRAEKYGWAANWQAVAIMSLMGLVFFAAAEPFTRLFTNDPRLVPLAVNYMKIMALSEPLLGCGMVLTGALQGAGETVQPTIVTAATFWAIRIPLAWLLSLKLGHQAAGCWVTMSLTTVISGIWTLFLYRSGKWKSKKV